MAKTVIVGSDSVKASQLKEFFRQIDGGIITGEILQAVLENRNPFGSEPPRFGKFEFRRLVYLIAGGEDKLISQENLETWRSLLTYAIKCMRVCYSKLPEGDPTREYFSSCWIKIDDAQSDEDFIRAIDYLVDTIKWQ